MNKIMTVFTMKNNNSLKKYIRASIKDPLLQLVLPRKLTMPILGFMTVSTASLK